MPTAPGGAPPTLAGLAGAGGAGEPSPRPYATVVVPGTKTRTGLVTTHQVRSRLLFEIAPRELDRDLLLVRTLRGSPNRCHCSAR
jgi:hypothetical protein